VACALGATRAEAHLVSTGMGPLYDGIGHFFLSPGEVLPAVGLALLGGLRGPAAGRKVLLLLPLAWLAGGAVGLLVGAPDAASTIPAAAALLLVGGLIAADCALPAAILIALPALVGVALGFYDGVAFRGAMGKSAPLLQLLGVGAMLFLITAIVAGFVVSLRPAWTRITVRVAGSWLAAIGLLLLGWSLRAG
jgi:hypothetical protein